MNVVGCLLKLVRCNDRRDVSVDGGQVVDGNDVLDGGDVLDMLDRGDVLDGGDMLDMLDGSDVLDMLDRGDVLAMLDGSSMLDRNHVMNGSGVVHLMNRCDVLHVMNGSHVLNMLNGSSSWLVMVDNGSSGRGGNNDLLVNDRGNVLGSIGRMLLHGRVMGDRSLCVVGNRSRSGGVEVRRSVRVRMGRG